MLAGLNLMRIEMINYFCLVKKYSAFIIVQTKSANHGRSYHQLHGF